MTKNTTKSHSVHPAAAVWPMLPEPDLRRLADDIATNGLRHPIVLNTEGQILDGRNREAACRIAGVKPEFETYDGDEPVGYILSANNERRHLSLPERAAATALTLATDGARENGRWKRGSVPDIGESPNKSTWQAHMKDAGLVLDHCPELLPKVASGTLALDAAVKEANEKRKQKEQRTGLRPDLGALVDAGELSLTDALRRNALPEKYTARVASGDLTLDEAERSYAEDQREYIGSIERAADAVRGVVYGWSVVSTLSKSAIRTDVLAVLSDHDREQFLGIEQEVNR